MKRRSAIGPLRFILPALLAVFWLGSSLVQAQEASIIHVEHTLKRGASSGPVPSFLPQFHDYREVSDQETFYVHWEPAKGFALTKPDLVFDYRLADGTLRSLKIAYPFDVDSRRRATFRISGEQTAASGEITAWRVRLFRAGRTITTQASDSWAKGRP